MSAVVVPFPVRAKCCICGIRMKEYEGNNPAPVKGDGICCNFCNGKFVIPARIDGLVGRIAE